MNDILARAPVNQPVLFQRLRWLLLRNTLRIVANHSAVRLVTILLCSMLVAGSVYFISLEGFRFLHDKGLPLLGGIVGMLFDLLFLALFVMLLFSSGLILYSSLFKSAESTFLLSTPARADQIFAYKYQGAVAFSSWAFLLLGSPILIAYGFVKGAPWHFYALLPLFFVGFALLPGCLGALICLLVVNYIPRRRKQVLVAAALALFVLIGLAAYQISRETQKPSWNRDEVMSLIGKFRFSETVLLPSHWMSNGFQAAVQGDLLGTPERAGVLYYLALLWSNGLFLYVLTAWAACHLYRRGHNRVATGGALRRRYGGSWLDRSLTSLLPFLDPQTRLLIIKDFRTFRRDPSQWAQIAIFAGLMTLYFTNIPRLYVQDIGWSNRNGISLLNLTATSLLLCTYTSRFIYPLLSLEGRKFWILGLLPLRRERLLWGKFAFSATGAVLIAEFLVILSDVMLEMPLIALGLHVVTVAVLAVGLSGLSVGLGACMPNFKETDPSKIAIGFGGTLNLVSGLLFLLLTICLMAVPWHLWSFVDEYYEINATRANTWIVAGVTLGVLVGVTAVVVPLRLGARTLRRMEF